MKTFSEFLTEALQTNNSNDDLVSIITKLTNKQVKLSQVKSKLEKILNEIKAKVLPKTIGVRGHDTEILLDYLNKHYALNFVTGIGYAMGDDYGYNYILANNADYEEIDDESTDPRDYICLFGIYDIVDIYDLDTYNQIKNNKNIHGDIVSLPDDEVEEIVDDNNSYLRMGSIEDWLDALSQNGEPIELSKEWANKLIKAKTLTKSMIKRYNVVLK